MLTIYFKQERITEISTQIVPENDSRRLETNSHYSPFARIHIINFECMYYIDQDFYMSKIEQIASNAELRKVVSIRIKLV